MAEYAVYARNPDLTKKYEITTYSSLDLISRFNLPGKWKISGVGDNPFAVNDGIIVERDDVVIFSGVMNGRSKNMNAEDFISRKWEASGLDDTGLLSYRIAVPDPTNLTITASIYDTRTGAAETVITNYVDYNCGPNAHTSRRFSNFIVASSSGRGSSVTGNARFHPLNDFIYNLALLGGGLGYRVRYDETTPRLVFECYQPTDKSADVMFSPELGNLKSFSYDLDFPTANFVWALGQGTGTSRGMGSAADAASVSTYGRIEAIKDQRNEPSSSLLASWAASEITKKAAKIGYAFTPSDIGDIGFLYGSDYSLGDKVLAVTDEGVTLVDTVTEVRIQVNSEGEETILPTIGTIKNVPLKEMYELVDDLENRVDTLETST